MSVEEIEAFGDAVNPDTMIAHHNTAGCDLCARTGFVGRTLLLDALLITSHVSQRDGIYHAMMNNVNEITKEDGVIFHSRRDGIIDLMLSKMVDPRVAVLHVEEG
jgi:general secretion pathway protein E